MFALIIQQIIATALAAFALLAPTPSMATATAAPVVVSTPSPRLPLRVVDGLQIVESADGCFRPPGYQPWCHPWWNNAPTGSGIVYAYYVPVLRTIVLRPGASAFVIRHETCHAHQHLTVLQELGYEPDPELKDWSLTIEARASGLGLEAWADRCALQGL